MSVAVKKASDSRLDSAQQEETCTHCGLTVPPGLVKEESDVQFCCSGCQVAFQLIRENGLDAFYGMLETGTEIDSPRFRKDRDHTEYLLYDSPDFLDKFAVLEEDGMGTITWQIGGIHCAACVWLIEKLPQIVKGVVDSKVNWARGTAKIRWDDNTVRPSKIAITLYRLGYRPQPLRENAREDARTRENRKFLIRIGVAFAAAGNNMLIAAALYLGLFHTMSATHEQMLRIASGIIGLISFAWPGQVFIRGAWNSIKQRTPHMDLPIAMGLLVGTVAGIVNTIRGHGEIYFDSLSVLVFLLLVGRWVQFRQQGRAADAIELLYQLTPRYARKIVEGQISQTLVQDLSEGDEVEIWAGDVIPADATLLSGDTHVDEAILTGESLPEAKAAGDEIFAGTQNVDGVVRAKVTAVGERSRLHKIVDMIESASADRPAVVQWANRIAGYFVLVVLALAAFAWLIWARQGLGEAVGVSVAVLIVACPCALGLATPLALSVALGRAARRKIMIKQSDAILRLSKPGMLWLDKTGTLTEGVPSLIHWHGDESWKPYASAIEAKSEHPIARAFVEDSCEGAVNVDTIENFSSGGVGSRIGEHDFLIGNKRLMEDQGISIDDHWLNIEQSILQNRHSPCWIAVDGSIVAVAELGDRVRRDSQSAINKLRSFGWEIGILSGDHPEIVADIARQLGIDADRSLGGLTPEDKTEIVKRSCEDYGTVAMVGDGVNDCPALAVAGVGIAVHQGAEASMQAAPVYLARNGLLPIVDMMQMSRATNRTIACGIAVSLLYNVLGIGMAIGGLINPLVAAILMPISSITVVAISLTAARRAAAETAI